MLKPILLVEDNPHDLELTLIALERSQLANDVVVMRDGAEALSYLQRTGAYADRADGNPAVLLLDLKLPKVDGLEVLKTVRETFLTPFDRRAITSLIGSMDDSIDEMQAAVLAMETYDVREFDQEMKDMVAIIVDAARVTSIRELPAMLATI